MDSAVTRPWYRLHWLTWVVMAVLIAALGSRQFERHFDGITQSAGYAKWWYLGWPTWHLELEESGIAGVRARDPTITFKYHWIIVGLATNLATCLLVLGSTTLTVEAWSRSSNRLQLNLRHFFALTAVISVMLVLMLRGQILPGEDLMFRWPGQPLIGWDDFQRPLHWPVLLGVACTIYSLGWLALWLLHLAYALVRP